jgi:hypothetical protein
MLEIEKNNHQKKGEIQFMKVVLFVAGIILAYWNYSCLSENISAIWHFVALALTLGFLGVIAFNWIFDLVSAPNYSSSSDQEDR